MQLARTHNTPAAIWTRVIRPNEDNMSPEAARFFLSLAFEQSDLDRMHDLTVRNQAGELSAQESEELKNFRQVGLELDFLRAKARGATKRATNDQ